MRIGLISDVHANIAALQAVLADLDRRGVDEIICLGDCIGYGPDPALCLDILFESCSAIVAGNHDHAAVGLLKDSSFNPLARQAVAYARDRLRPEQLDQLRELPLEIEREGLLLVHSSPFRPDEFPYLHSCDDAAEAFAARPFSVAVCGHTHVPLCFRSRGRPPRISVSLNPAIDLSEPGRVLCNVGSVGQPRDRDPRASYALFDGAKRSIHLHRVAYDIRATSKKIVAAGLPEALGRRLFAGV